MRQRPQEWLKMECHLFVCQLIKRPDSKHCHNTGKAYNQSGSSQEGVVRICGELISRTSLKEISLPLHSCMQCAASSTRLKAPVTVIYLPPFLRVSGTK